jgi:branched-chain amino acid transport system ATP-binding protein
MLLEVNDLNVYYGAIHALQGISFHVEKGEIVTLIGANGAGKSTTLNAISGIVRARGGSIKFKGEPITKSPAHDIVKMGVVHVPEGRQIFAPLTVKENLDMGAFTRSDPKGIKESLERVYQSFPRLKERLNQLGGTLSGGEQQMLAMGRGLMSEPELLLLDEPSMGLAPLLVDEIFAIIEEINSQGTSILLVEQNAQMALSIADRAYVLETGRLVLEGSAQELAANPRVQEAYLGG